MKILYICKYFAPEYGGMETLSKNICDYFYKRNFHIEVLCFSKNKQFISSKFGYKTYYFKSIFNLFSTPISLSMILFLFKNYKKYDRIHIFTPNPWVTFWLNFLPHKEIIVSWGSDIINQKILKLIFNPFQSFFLKKSKTIICLSKTYFNYSKDLLKFKKKVIIIPPLLIMKKFNKIKKKKQKKIELISVGRLVDYKGHDIAINSLKFLPENYLLKIIGDGKKFKKLKKQILKLKLNKRVTIHKGLSNTSKFTMIKEADIFLMCSRSRAESFGIAILEAISVGLPLVISNIKGSGMNDMIKNNYNGYKFKNESYIDCANQIKRISQNKKKLKNFSNNSKKLYLKKFDFKSVSNKLINIYK